MERFLRRAAGFATLLLAACGGGGGGSPGDPGSAPDYLPLAIGNRWAFDDGSQSEVIGQRDAGGQRWWVLQDTPGDGSAATEGLLRTDAQGAYTRAENSQGGAVESVYFPLPAVVGARFGAASYHYAALYDYDGNGTLDDVDLQGESTVVGFETVVTPAGRFEGALHLRQTYSSTITYRPSGATGALSSGTGDVWLAPGVGPVRMASTDNIDLNGGTSSASALLAGYLVGGRSGGTLPPR